MKLARLGAISAPLGVTFIAVSEHRTFTIAENVLYDNRTPGDQPAPGDPKRQEFENKVHEFWKSLSAWPAVREADFATDFALSP